MARPRKPYDQLSFKRPNSRHNGRDQPTVLYPQIRCGFCGRSQGEVDQIVQGHDGWRYSYICNDCVADAVAVLDAASDAPSDGAA